MAYKKSISSSIYNIVESNLTHRMRILWFSNVVLNDTDTGATGTWLHAMSRELSDTGLIELGNVSDGNVIKVTSQNLGSIKQWVVPSVGKTKSTGVLSKQFVNNIIRIIEEFRPDLIHIWGTEGSWGLLTLRNKINIPILLGIQGIKGAISKFYSADLTIHEMFKCIGFKELINKSTIFQSKRDFYRWGKIEKEIISGHKYIVIQSKWSEAQVMSMNKDCIVYNNDRLLRKPFYECNKWEYNGNPIIFFSSAYPSPFKGLHVVIRALNILKVKFPNVTLRVAGIHNRSGLRRDGYVAWIVNEIRRLKLESNVIWIKPIPSLSIIEELQKCSVVVIPSFIESYSNALAESMMVGTPAVISYTGGMVTLAKDEESVLFFSPGDVEMCAYQIIRLIEDKECAEKISICARKSRLLSNNIESVIKRQMEIYKSVIDLDS
jgi:L-malate glycosyltransferase